MVDLPGSRPDLDVLIDVALQTGGETQRFDFKEALDLGNDEHKLRLVRAVGAFGNTEEGGFLIVGVSDDRRMVGLDPVLADAFDQSRVQRLVAQYLAPPPVVQVRQHHRDGHRVVVIEIQPFASVPSLVRQSATFGGERLVAGTLLYRNRAAESAVLTSEVDISELCAAVVRRRVSEFADLLSKAQFAQPRTVVGSAPAPPQDAVAVGISYAGRLSALSDKAAQEWNENIPYVEVAFVTDRELALTPEHMRLLIPGATVPIQHRFPFHEVSGAEVQRPTPWGWYGRIPFAALGRHAERPAYLWFLSRDGAFLDREHLWEDQDGSVIRGGVGLFHLVGRVILLIRFTLAYARTLDLDPGIGVRLSLRVQGTRGRFLEDENRAYRPPMLQQVDEASVSAVHEVMLRALRRDPKVVAVALLEEIAWQFGRHDMTRHEIQNALTRAMAFLGPEYRLIPPCWHRVEIPDGEFADASVSGLMNQTARAILLTGASPDARVFHDRRVSGARVYYFSPAAAWAATDVLQHFATAVCDEEPDLAAMTEVRL